MDLFESIECIVLYICSQRMLDFLHKFGLMLFSMECLLFSFYNHLLGFDETNSELDTLEWNILDPLLCPQIL